MGIRSLTKFVDTHYARWERGRRVQGTLVVDGNCILHSLHTMEWSNGGQYREFRNAVCRFYSKLLESGITPIVVFDGVDEAQKIDTLLRRKREWVNTIHKRITDNASRQPKSHGRILPPLSSEVYRMALYSLDIQFYVADGEADVVTARLANYYGCPVLSQDSDFYVFRLVGGFIHFDRFYGNSRVVTADVYHRDQFTAQLCLRDTSLFCIIPAIVGNDFMVPCTVGFVSRIVCSLSNTGSAGSNIRAICRHLSHFSSVREFTELSFGGKKLELRCQKALEWYEVPDNLSCKELVSSTNLRHHNGDRFPEWLVRLFHLGRLPSSPMDAAISSQAIFRVVADNFQKESSVLAGQPIRRHMYALLEVETVVEVVRCGLTITGVKTTRRELSGVFRGVTVASIESLGHQERQSLFYEILECDKLNINLKLSGSYQDWRFVAATVSYWAKTTCPPEHLVRALLLCFMLCSGLPDAKFNSLRRWLLKLPSAFRQSQEWLDTLHWFSQWQAIYHAAWTLNALLMEPMLVFSPAFLYDGELVMYLASSGDTTERLCEVDTTLYNRLEEIVFSAQLVTPPYSASESSSDTASIEESVHSDEADLTRESPRLATASINSVDEHQGPSNAQSTHSTQVTSDKRQNMHTHQTQDTTSRHSTDEHQGVTDTQNTPSPQVECSKEQVKPKHEDMEHIGEQQKSIEHANIAWGSEAETTTVGQSAVQSGTTTPKTKRKRSRQKKAKPKTANVEVVSGTGGNTPDKRPMDSPSTAIPSAHSSAKKPSELKSPAATTMDSTNDTAHAKRKRKRSRHKKAQPTQQTRKEMTHHNRQTGNSSNPPGIDSSPLAPQPVGVQISSVQGAGAMSVADKPVQVRTQIEQGEGPATSPKRPSSTTLSAPQNGKDRLMVQTMQLAARTQKPAVIGHNEGKLKDTLPPKEGAASHSAVSTKRRRRRHRGKAIAVPQREAQNPREAHCEPNPAAGPSSSPHMTGQQAPATTTEPAPQRNVVGTSKKCKEGPKNKTVHVSPRQDSHSCPAAQKAASGHSVAGKGQTNTPGGGEYHRQCSQASPKSSGSPHSPQVSRQLSKSQISLDTASSSIGSRQRAPGPKSDGTPDTSQGPGLQPSPSLSGLPANAKRRRNRRRRTTKQKAPPSEAHTATNAT